MIIHEDHKTPIVAINVWYHVGSKNEKPGKTGFAHLFEHLMFNGSENFDDDYFQAMERIGATDLNGTTNEDRTNYFQNVPSSAIDVALWMESDRMGHMTGAISQEKLDEQRGVVQNEKRQYENQPYGIIEELLPQSTYPQGHPYSWSIIGSMQDLDSASLKDVHDWFNTYYGAANATIVIAGDISAKEAKSKVEKYFGDIPSGPPLSKHQEWVAKRTATKVQIVQDRVPQARLYKIWNIPRWGSIDDDYLNLVSDILGSGKNSRLYKRLVYTDQIATDVSVFVDSKEISGQFFIEATVKPSGDLALVEKAIDEELNRFLDEGPTDKELDLVKTRFITYFIRGTERIGGFGGKSDILAMNQIFTGDPAFYKITLNRINTATKKDLHQSARKWLSDGDCIFKVLPYPKHSQIETKVDRSRLPAPQQSPTIKFPALERTTLSNGLDVIFVERHSVPFITFNLLINAGFAADQFAKPGTAKLMMEMLDEGTQNKDSLEIDEELAMLGAKISSGSNLDISSVYLSTPIENLEKALEIFTDILLHPSFPQKEFDRLKKQLLAFIQREKITPVQMALRVVPGLLYGQNHAYGNPLTGSGTEQSVSEISLQDMFDFHQKWFKPNNATLVVVGDTTLKEITPKLEILLKSWQKGSFPDKNIHVVEHKESSEIYIIDKPDALQSIIFASHISPPQSTPDEIAIEAMNNILGGTFTSRINMNLREQKHWAYGAFSFFVSAQGQRPFIAYAPVQSDKTSDSMIEILNELGDIRGQHPPTKTELEKVKNKQILELPGLWETMGSVSNSIGDIVRFGLSDDYYNQYPEKIKTLTLQDLALAARNIIFPDKLVWVIVGDRKKIEQDIQKLNIGKIYNVESDGLLI